MKQLKKSANVLLAFILAFSMCPIVPASAMAVEGDLQAAAGAGLTAGSASVLSGGEESQLTAQAVSEVTSWEELHQAIDNASNGDVIALRNDITAGDGDKSLKLEKWQICTIDLNGYTIDRHLTSQDDDNGHVIDVYRGTLTIKDSKGGGKITGGYAKNGGGIVISGSGHLNFESGTITGNQAYNGGGIYVYERDGEETGIQLNMTGGIVTENYGGDCGGIYNHGGTISLTNVTITKNGTRGAGGAGVNNKGTATLTSCVISENTSDGEGGGVYNNSNGNLTLNNCSITSNTTKSDGGALCSYGTAKLTECTLNNNKAEASGGAIRVHGGTVELNHTTLNKNEATWFGGGIYINNDGSLKLLNSTEITENIGYHGGGGAYVESQTTEVQVGSGVVVKDNQANNIYLKNGKKLNVIERLQEGTAIGVSLENYGGTFTTGFAATNEGVDPNSVFVAEPGYSVIRDASNGEAHVVTSDWINLQKLIDETEDGGMLILERSWQAVDENVALSIPTGKRITIDLNGYTIDRHRSSYVADGEVFTVNGELSIVDNSFEKKGSIKGGYGDVGGIRVNGGGTLKLQSGNITGNHAQGGGGGVRVFAGGTLETYGGAISGNKSDTDGGGVHNEGTFVNAVCNIANNTAGGNGGGVYTVGEATFDSGNVSSNKANGVGGGACIGGGTLSIKGGSVSSNTANGSGGGLYVTKGTAAIDAGEIVSNSAGTAGGGICICSDGSVSLKDGRITGNYAYSGGGIFAELNISDPNGRLYVSGAPQVTQNTAVIGKNILLSAGGDNGNAVTIADPLDSNNAHLDVMTLDSSKALTNGFTSQSCNIACFTTKDVDQSQLKVQDDELYIKQAEGGVRVSSWSALQSAINDAASGTTIVFDQSIQANEDDDRLIVEDGKNVTIDLNGYELNRHIDNNEGSNGHVIEVDEDSTLTIQDTVGTGVITGGYADNGGGIYVHKGSTLNLLGGIIMGNRADKDGGGVYARGTFNSTGGAIVRNRADDNGGGVYAEEDGNLNLSKTVIANNTSHNEGGGVDVRVDRTDTKLTECQIRDNNAENDHGGGVYLNKSSLLLTLENCDVQGNHSDNGHKGGGVYVDDGRITVNGGSISNNSAQEGGGIYNDECAVVLNDTTLSGNSTSEDSGGATSNYGSCQLYRCTFTGNAASANGGAVYTEGDDYLKAENCTFDNNRTDNKSGGAIYTRHGTTLTNCTFTNNSSHTHGGAVYTHGDVTVKGGSFNGNEAVEYGGAIECGEDSTLRLDGTVSEVSITNNKCSLGGSGVNVEDNAHYISLAGKVTIKDNEMENDLSLAGDKCVDVVGDLTGSQIRVVLDRGTGTFTTNLKNYIGDDVDPATIFFAPTGQWVLPTDDREAQIVPSDWPLLQKMINEANDGATLTLDRDWKAAPENESLKVSGKSITIDLNGHTIDRARTQYEAAGEVFTVAGTLTVKDSSTDAAGKICGGYGGGGGVVVQDGGTFRLESGNISGNRGKNGAGVLAGSGGTFIMSGGAITDNHAELDGGGVHTVYRMEMTGGRITGNEASGTGGGIAATGTTYIGFGNAPIVIDNIASQAPNLWLGSAVGIEFLGQQLTSEARIDFTAQRANRAFTKELSSSGNDDVALTVFTYDKSADRLEIRADGELYLTPAPGEVVEVSDWQALQTAIKDPNNQGSKVIRLTNDIKAGDDDDYPLKLDHNTAIVDLNGHTLNRNLDEADEDGHVFWLVGASTLTIRDSAGAGRVMGGYAEHGGAINIAGDCTCIVEGGAFVESRASDEGGAFYVYGTLKMTGGAIMQNTTDSGGGIFVDESGTIELTNVTIVNNKAEKWGGGAINNKGNATLTNCTIKENWADNEGGAIYNGAKQLTIDGCTITKNSSSGGGGLCCYGTVNINNTTISDNYGDDYGGGLYTRGTVTISGSHITNNKGKTDGGGIFNQGGLLTVTGTEFSGNTTEAGGGALNNKGTAALTNCTLTGNHADSEGGCIYEGTDGATTIDGCTIQSNSCGKDGGGISACGSMTITGSTIIENTADVGGGGVYSYGDTTIVGTTIEKNKAKETGGGLLSRKRTLTLDGATVTGNSASSFGGGLIVEGGSGDVIVKGATTIENNEGSADVFLSAGKVLTVGGALEDGSGNAANISFRTESGVGTIFTSGYSDANAGKDPATYFKSNDGYLVYLEGVEASTKKETAEDNPFIDPGSQMNPDIGTLTGVNWMSGLSGELHLNEINMPGTHDSGTKSVKGNLSTGELMDYIQIGGAALGAIIGVAFPALLPVLSIGLSAGLANEINNYCSTFANCQTRYIDEQLQDGIRHLDIRCNTYYVEYGWPPRAKKDNGVDLYICHGKVATTGTFYAYDERTSDVAYEEYDYITFKDTLAWIKAFLEEHPTETIMMNVQVESVDDVQDEGIARIKKHLHDELATQINPSTGKPYLYMQDGVFGRLYTEYPQLKDCRGQVVLDCGDGDAEILGGLKKGVGLESVQGPDGGYTDNAAQKIRNLRRFFADHGYDNLPSTAKEVINYLYSVGTNGTDARSIPQITPLEIAHDVLEVLFGEDGLLLNKEGKYIGLINMDNAIAENNKVVWSSNFFKTQQYCKVTSKSGLSDGVEKVSYVLYGTKIDIPECIFANPNAEGKYFQTWQGTMDNSISGNTWSSDPGETFIITGDTTFTALWGDQNTPVSVMWRDAENKDKLRPTELSITVKGIQQPVKILPNKNWKVAIPGDVKVGDITVNWDGISADDPAKYTCKVREREGGMGIVIELTHTPQGNVQASGTIKWVDNDNAAGKRPENVTIHLVADESRVIDSAIVKAEDGWAWDLGTRPQYVDGAEVSYSVREVPVTGYSTYDKGFEITNVYGNLDGISDFTGRVVWSDQGDKLRKRPDQVTVNLLKDGQKIDSKNVVPDENGVWKYDFKVSGNLDEATYTVTEEEVEGYTTKIFNMQETGGASVVLNMAEAHEHTITKTEMVLLQPTCTTKGLKRTIEACDGCGEILTDKSEDIPATGHDWGAWKTVKEATSTQAGSEQRTCTKCGKVETRVIPKKGHTHTLVKVEAKDASCTEDGNIEYWKCTDGDDPCGLYFRDAAGTDWIHQEATVVHATGHDWGEWTVVQEPTELMFGFEKRVCANNPAHVEFRVIPMTGHVHGLTRVEAKAATCTEDGNIEYWQCTEGDNPCKLCFKDEAGTQWVHQEGTVVHATGHNWGEWRIVKAPTESEPGAAMRLCHNSPLHMQMRDIPKVGHVHNFTHVQAKAPTCTEAGNIEYWHCEECGLYYRDPSGVECITEEDTVIPALGHEWGEATYEWSADDTKVTATHVCLRDQSYSESETVDTITVPLVPPTCTEPGKSLIMTKIFESSRFMPQVKQGVGEPALGHDWGEWVVVTPATETTEGLEQRTCERCGGVETRAIPAVVAYRYVGPDGASWTKGGADALTLTFKRSIDDGKTFGLFAGITVDGVAVPATGASGAANYTAASGSLVLALQPAFLETLSVGDHKLVASFEDGSAAATFAVKAAPAPTKPASEKVRPAKTGDALPVAAIVIVAAVAALAVALLLIARRKRNS